MMGYRSEVALKILFPDDKSAKEFLAPRRIAHASLIDAMTVDRGKGGVVAVLHTDGGMWYDDLGPVRFYTQLRDDAEEAGFGVAFIRVGEAYDDVEMRFADTLTRPMQDYLHTDRIQRRLRTKAAIEGVGCFHSTNVYDFLTEGEQNGKTD